jgi:iron complex outermembrane receptor protein
MKLITNISLLLLGLLVLPVLGNSQRTITGTVTDSNSGETLIGASILVVGTSTGTVSDVDGTYSIQVPAGAESLQFSYTGFTTVTVPIGVSNVIDVRMEAGSLLDEVVVIGYGTVKKEDATGAVNAINSKDFNGGAIVSPEQLIAGKIPGVAITQNSGEPGGKPQIRIRGGTSVNAGNEPLFVIDGVPIDNEGTAASRNPLNFLNSSDIESYTVLKDASATAIYGSRGANGVIIITTKKGKKGSKGQVTYDSYYTTSKIVEDPNILTAEQFRNVVTYVAPSRLEKLGTANTDWFDEMTRTAKGYNHSLSFSGGAENIGYRASVGYQKLEGVLKGSQTERTSIALNYNHTMFHNRLNVNANVRGAFTKDLFDQGQLGSALFFDPTQPVYDEKNTAFAGFFEYGAALTPRNPVSTYSQIKDIGRGFRNLGNVEVEYKFDNFIPGLAAKANLGYDIFNGKKRRFVPTTYANTMVSNYNGEAVFENPSRTSRLLESYLTYKRNLGDVHALDLVAGYSFQHWDEEYPWFRAYNLSSNVFEFNSLGPAEDFEARNYVISNRLISFYGRANYSLMSRYLFTVTVRRDGSSRFSPNNRWGTFPSAAFAWRILEEDFASGLGNVFSDLKLRLGYGITGNQEIGDFNYLPTYTFSDAKARYQFGYQNGEPVFVTTVRPNGYDANLKWEETSSYNLGLDFGFMEGRVNGSFEYYYKKTNDLLFVVNIPAGTNLTDRILTNIGEVENKGVELNLNAVVLDKKDLNWNVNFNISRNNNKVLAIDQVSDQGVLTGNISGGVGNQIQILQVGQSVNSFYVFKQKYAADGSPLRDGVDYNEDGEINLADMYEDLNGDGTVSDLDKRPFKKPAANYLIGASTQVSFKGLDFGFTLRGSIGNYVYNNNASNAGYFGVVNERGDLFLNNMNTSALVTNFQNPQYFSDYYVEKADFLKVDNATLGYTFPKFGSQSSLRLYITATNPFVFTKYSGSDPEIGNGIDNRLYPRSRAFLFGLSLGL